MPTQIGTQIVPVRSIEDLEMAVAGTETIPTQIGPTGPSGRIGVAALGGTIITHGRFDANIDVSGPLSEDAFCFGMVLRTNAMRIWSHGVKAGDFCICAPGTVHTGRHNGRTEYAVMTLDRQRLSELAESEGADLSPAVFGNLGMFRANDKMARLATSVVSRKMDHLFSLPQPMSETRAEEVRDDLLLSFLARLKATDLAYLENPRADRRAR